MEYQTIQTELINGVLVVRQNRADKLNARNALMYVELMTALRLAGEDDSVVLVMLTSAGRFFSAGMDFVSDPSLAYT